MSITAAPFRQTTLSVPLSMLSLLLCFCTMATASSVFAWNHAGSDTQQNALENMSGLLSARGGSEVQSLVNAKRILQDLSTSPSCAYQPTARLLRQCKSIKPKTEDASSDLQKANVQATYAITMALCEANQARVPTPPRCQIFEDLSNYEVSTDSIAIVRRDDIEGCMNTIFESSLWTSYSNFRIQSNDLCDTSRVDYQREELLETFRKATSVVPEVLAALKEHEAESISSLRDLNQLSADLSAAQERMIISSNEQANQAKLQLDQIAQYVETYMQLIDESGKSWQTNLKERVQQASQDMALMDSKANSMQASFAELYAQAIEAMSGTTYGFETSVEAMTLQVHEIVRGLVDLDAQGNLDTLRNTLELSHDAATHFAQTQTKQYQMTKEHLELGKDLLLVIKDSHGHFHQIKETLDMFPDSWFEALHKVHGTLVKFRDELKYSLLFLLPSLLLLLLGRLKMSAIIFLSYAFLRTTRSVTKSLQFEMTNLFVTEEDLKLLLICTFGAVCAGGSAAFVGSFCLSLFRRYRKKPEAHDVEHDPALPSSPADCQHYRNRRSTLETTASSGSYFNSSETLQRPKHKQSWVESDRFVRSATVPFDFAPL